MRFLADENFPLDAVDALHDNGHYVIKYFEVKIVNATLSNP
jgi:hypothetical protein